MSLTNNLNKNYNLNSLRSVNDLVKSKQNMSGRGIGVNYESMMKQIENNNFTVKESNELRDIIAIKNIKFVHEYTKIKHKSEFDIKMKMDGEYKGYHGTLKNQRGFILRIVNNTNMNRTKYDWERPKIYGDFDMCSVSLFVNKSEQYIVLDILGSSVEIIIKPCSDSQSDGITIATALNKAVLYSKGYKSNILTIAQIPNFYKKYFIKNTSFISKAKTGDLLIFRGFEYQAQGQRACTCSEYDHAAGIIRKNNQGKIYEATGKYGCKERYWKDFQGFNWNLLYEKIVYRKLKINIQNKDLKEHLRYELQSKAEEFINKTNGKNYAIDIWSIGCGGNVKENERNNEWEKTFGFTCSSLVCGAYINMGVISNFCDTSSVLPGNFSEKKQMGIKTPFELGPETIINYCD